MWHKTTHGCGQKLSSSSSKLCCSTMTGSDSNATCGGTVTAGTTHPAVLQQMKLQAACSREKKSKNPADTLRRLAIQNAYEARYTDIMIKSPPPPSSTRQIISIAHSPVSSSDTSSTSSSSPERETNKTASEHPEKSEEGSPLEGGNAETTNASYSTRPHVHPAGKHHHLLHLQQQQRHAARMQNGAAAFRYTSEWRPMAIPAVLPSLPSASSSSSTAGGNGSSASPPLLSRSKSSPAKRRSGSVLMNNETERKKEEDPQNTNNELEADNNSSLKNNHSKTLDLILRGSNLIEPKQHHQLSRTTSAGKKSSGLPSFARESLKPRLTSTTSNPPHLHSHHQHQIAARHSTNQHLKSARMSIGSSISHLPSAGLATDNNTLGEVVVSGSQHASASLGMKWRLPSGSRVGTLV